MITTKLKHSRYNISYKNFLINTFTRSIINLGPDGNLL